MIRTNQWETRQFIQLAAALIAAFALFIGVATTSRADGDYHWLDTFSDYFDSTGDQVHAMDISPSGKMYVAGFFTHVGQNIEVNHVAMWDGAEWHPLGRGVGANFGVLPHFAKIIAVSDTQVYFAGFFATIRNALGANCDAETLTVNGIAMWDGQCWHGFGPDSDSYGVHIPAYAQVNDIAFFDGALWAVGLFQFAGETEAHGIAKWNGSAWEAVGGEPYYGMGSGSGGALATDGTTLYIAGGFDSINGVPMLNVAKYSTAGGFAPVAAGLGNLNVYRMLVVGDTVYAGGFPTDGSDNALYASTNGGSWNLVGGGLNDGAQGGQIFALAFQNNELYVGGQFLATGDGQTIINLAKWNTQTLTWSEFGNPLAYPSSAVSQIKFYDGRVYVSGSFTQIGGKQSIHLAIYDPNAAPPPPETNLNLSLETTENAVNSGNAFAFCITVDNYGPDAATGVSLTTSVPNGTTFDALSFDNCYGGGGGGESRRMRRASGLAFPTLTPNCLTPNVGDAGAIECTLDDLQPFDSQTIRIDVTVTAAPNSLIEISASVAGNEPDPNENNNAANANVTVRPIIAYVSSNANCGSSTPCFEYLSDAFDAIADGGTVNILAGSYNNSLYLANNNTVNVLGNVTLNGDLYLDSGVMNAGDNTFTVNGNLYNHGAAFNHTNGTFRFNSGGVQSIYGAFPFFDVVIESGTTLEMGQNTLNFSGTLTNNGILQYNNAPEYVGQGSDGIFEDGTNQEAVRLISTGANDLGETYVSVVMGQPAPQCGDDVLPAPRSILRHFDIAPSGSENISATVRLSYSAAELNGADPNTVKIYHCGYNTETFQYEWELLPSQPGPNGTYYVEAQGVMSFSPFALGGSPLAPTAATLVSVNARAHKKDGVSIEWETGTELTIVGFNVWRSTKRNGAYKLVNNNLILANAAGQAQGAQYTLLDKRVKAGKTYFYKIQVVKTDGSSEWSKTFKFREK